MKKIISVLAGFIMFTLAAGYAQAEKLCASGGKKEATFSMFANVINNVSINTNSANDSIFLLYWNTPCDTDERVRNVSRYQPFSKDFYCGKGGKILVRATSGCIEVKFTTKAGF